MSTDGGSGHHDVFCGGAGIFLVLDLRAVTKLHSTLRVSELGGCAENNGGIVALAELVSKLDEILCLLAVGGLEHGNVSSAGDHSRVLLILRACQSGIVCNHEHGSAANAGIGEGIKRVCRNVQTNVLHARHASYSRYGSADGYLCGNLFVGGPFGVNLVIFCKIFTDFCAGGSGVCAGELYARLICASCNSLVAKHHCFL